MHFKSILILAITLVAGGSFAVLPQAVFGNNRKSILAGCTYKVGGYYFGVGKGVARTMRSAADNFAKEKAIQNASANLISRKAIEGVVWPVALDESSVAVLSRLALNEVTVSANVSGFKVLSVEMTGTNVYTAVVAAPEANLQDVPCASFDEIRRTFLHPRWLKANFKLHPQELFKFYLTQKKLPSALEGIDFKKWNEEQVDLFCGLQRNIVTANSVSEKTGQDVQQGTDCIGGGKAKDEKLPMKGRGFVGNINETIGF